LNNSVQKTSENINKNRSYNENGWKVVDKGGKIRRGIYFIRMIYNKNFYLYYLFLME